MNRAIPMAVLVLVLGGGAGPVRASTLVRISDLDYIHRTYYFIADHPLYLDHASLRVFRDDRNPTNDVYTNPRPGRARLDPRAPQGPANPETPGYFDILTAGVDYNVIDLYIPQAGAEIPILEMTAAQDINSVLGVSYVEQVGSESIAVGNSDFFATDPALGKNAGEYLLKAIKADYGIPSTLNDGTYDPSDPWYPILNYELRNLYRLGIEHIDRSRTVITVRQRDAAFSVDPDSFHGSSFLSLLGLDQIGATLGSPPDGKVDDQFIDSGRGILFFPDLHPFDPDTARAGCPADHGGFLCLDNLARNPLRDCYASDCIAN